MRHKAQTGFTLIELAIVMVILGVLAGGGVSLLKILTEQKVRSEAAEVLSGAGASLAAFSSSYGRLPFADTDGDGLEDSGDTAGQLPWQTLGLGPHDPFQRALNYEVSAGLTTDQQTSCASLESGLSGRPELVELLGSASPITVAAVIVSAGPRDADSNGDPFDGVSGSPGGDNTDGSPNYVRGPPVTGFDDVVRYTTGADAFLAMRCADVLRTFTVEVTNTSGQQLYLHDTTQGTCLGALDTNATTALRVIRGHSIELTDAVDYGASAHVGSTPATPRAATSATALTVTAADL